MIVKGVLNDEIQLVGPFFIKVKINLNSLKNKVLPFTKWMGRPPIQIFINRKGISLSQNFYESYNVILYELTNNNI